MASVFFVTGTDTDAGKTRAACALLAAARQQGYSTAALKPVASGVNAEGFNEDAVSLSRQCVPGLAPGDINPVCFRDPIAPHIAAAEAGVTLDAASLAARCAPVLAMQADLTLVEGAGGWKVPLNAGETLADLVRIMDLPVILVVGMRLGCLNHALLTAQAIASDGLRLAGWIANGVDPAMARYEDNLESLRARLPAPLLAQIPWQEKDGLVLEWADGFSPAALLAL